MRIALIIIAAAAAAFLIAVSAVIYKYIFYMSDARKKAHWKLPSGAQFERDYDRMCALIAAVEEIPYEEVRIRAKDGLELFGRFYPGRDDRPVALLFHGWHGQAQRDFAGGHKIARENGCPILLVDERAHGRSGGHTTTFGIRERLDCTAWAEYAAERFGAERPLFLVGVSMGAAAVCMASDQKLPGSVRGIIADCPFSSPKAIISTVARRMHLSAGFLWPFVCFAAAAFGHFRITQSSAVTAVQKTKLPLLLLHGEADRFVPCAMSGEIFAACASEKEIATFPGAGHGVSFLADEERYRQIVLDFMDRHGARER